MFHFWCGRFFFPENMPSVRTSTRAPSLVASRRLVPQSPFPFGPSLTLFQAVELQYIASPKLKCFFLSQNKKTPANGYRSSIRNMRTRPTGPYLVCFRKDNVEPDNTMRALLPIFIFFCVCCRGLEVSTNTNITISMPTSRDRGARPTNLSATPPRRTCARTVPF